MEKQRVLLLCTQPLFGEGLEAMLRELENVEVVGPWAPGPHVLAQLAGEEPGLILIAEGEQEDWAALTTRILEQMPGLPVIRIQSKGNVVRLYTSRALPARVADIMEAVQGLTVTQ